MGRKLPIRAAVPSVDATRKRLGGRATTEAGGGELVRVTTELGLETDGVVLFVRGDEMDVWIGDDTVLRTRRARVRPGALSPSGQLIAVATDAAMFAGLSEGQRVRYDHDGAGEATLLEKCRFGALLQRDDGAIVGVGFRRLWPLLPPAEQN